MPFFSVIVPVYNVAPWLRECLDSILAQTFADWECVCVDDGSTDGSGAILDEYASKDARFRVIHQTNKGVSAARNRALDAIQGTFFLFVDGDDAIVPDSLDCFEKALRETESDALLSHPYHAFLSRKEWEKPNTGFEILSSNVQPLKILAGRFQANGYVMSRVFRRSVFGSVRFPAGVAMAEDVRFQSDCLCLAAKWTVIRKDYYYYRIGRPGAATKGSSTQMCLENVDALAYVVRNMRTRMKASDENVRAYVRRFGGMYRRHLTLVFRQWRELPFEDRSRTIDCVRRCRDAVGGWPFRFSDRLRLLFWEARLREAPFLLLAFSDRAADSISRRTKKLFKRHNFRNMK